MMSDDELKRNDEKSDSKGWAKKVATIVGIFVGVTTILTATYAVLLENRKFSAQLEKERYERKLDLQQQKEELEKERKERELIKKAAEEERSRQLEIQYQIEKEKTKQREREIRANINLEKEKTKQREREIKANINIEKEKTKQKKLEADRSAIEQQKEREKAKLELAKLEDEAASAEREKFYQSISDIVDSDEPEFSSLLFLLSKSSDFENYQNHLQNHLLDALVSNSDRTVSLGEIDIIFQIFNRIGSPAINPVIKINRSALKRFNESLIKFSLYRISKILNNKNYDWRNIKTDLKLLVEGLPQNKLVDPTYQRLIVIESLIDILEPHGVQFNQRFLSNQLQGQLVGDSQEKLIEKISANASLINHSEKFILNYLSEIEHKLLFLDYIKPWLLDPKKKSREEIVILLGLTDKLDIDLSNTYLANLFNYCFYSTILRDEEFKIKNSIIISPYTFKREKYYRDSDEIFIFLFRNFLRRSFETLINVSKKKDYNNFLSEKIKELIKPEFFALNEGELSEYFYSYYYLIDERKSRETETMSRFEKSSYAKSVKELLEKIKSFEWRWKHLIQTE